MDYNETESCYEPCPPSFDCNKVCSPPSLHNDYPINSPPPPPFQTGQSVRTISMVVSVFVFTTIFLCTCWARHRGEADTASPTSPTNTTNEDHDQAQNPADYTIHIATVGLEKSVINSIHVCIYERGQNFIEGAECVVCLGEFIDGENLRVLPNCCHAFHVACIDMWLISHLNCPLCRADIVSDPMNLTSKDPSLVLSVSAVESSAGNSPSQGHVG